MAIQINYQFRSKARTKAAARQVVAKLREHALKLPFHEVDEIVEFSREKAFFGAHSPLCRHFSLLLQSGEWLFHGESANCIAPSHIIGFSVMPSPDSEQAHFGLCTYPSSCEIEEPTGELLTIKTDLPGWRWSASVQTDHGGINEDFLRNHLLIVSLLGHAQEMLILKSVEDAGQFWERRDPQLLAKRAIELKEAGDHQPGPGEPAMILRFPDFDRLMSEFEERD